MMKAGNKISLIYSGITISIVVLVGVVLYVFASGFTDRLYYRYLEEKARLIGMERFEKDELPAREYSRVVEEREKALPTDRHVIINIGDSSARSDLRRYVGDGLASRLLSRHSIRFRCAGGEVGVGIPYVDNEGVFAILLFSRNAYGTQLSHAFGWALIPMMLLAALVLWLFSRLYAIRMVDRIDRDYQAEKLFVGNASHEINNPLTAIQGECEIALMRERSGEEYRSSLRRIESETGRVVSIMRQLLQFSHARNEKFQPDELDRVDIAQLLRPLCVGIVSLTVDENFCVFAKHDLLAIAMRNLVGNALKYGGGRGVQVSVRRPAVVIEDHGIGISPRDLKHVFEPFYRGSNAMRASGHGVGLALSREIFERFGAKVSVESALGQGTRFTVRFRSKD